METDDLAAQVERLDKALGDQHASTDALWNERTDLAAKLHEAEEENREHTAQSKAEEQWRSDIMAAIHEAGLAIADGFESRFKLIPHAEPKDGTLAAKLEIARKALKRIAEGPVVYGCMSGMANDALAAIAEKEAAK